MLFNSYPFIFAFLPITLLVFYFTRRFNTYNITATWLIAASLYFYSQWFWPHLWVLLGSVLFNYTVARLLCGNREVRSTAFRKALVALGLTGNLACLGYFKYCNFLAEI